MSNRIADFRSMRGMSLDDLSEASGLAKSTLSELERGMTQPMLDSARRIASALDAYEHEIWPEDATMPLTTRTVDTELAAAKARIAELETTLAAIESADWTHMEQAQERIAALEKALEPFAREEIGTMYKDPWHLQFSDPDGFVDFTDFTIGDLRRAAALLKDK